MRRFIILAAVLCLASCDVFGDMWSAEDKSAKSSLDGNTLTYSTSSFTHTYTLEETELGATVSFSAFPSGVQEFTEVQTRLLGKSKPGTLALCIMAFEIYRRDRAAGESCIKKCNLSANATITMSRLKEKFPARRGATTDSYQQPYLVASYLKGATRANNYSPDKPYVIILTLNDNPNVAQGEYSTTYKGSVWHYYVSCNGDDRRDADVLEPDDNGLIMVHGCGNLVMSVPAVSDWKDTLE
ncbi:MAG: hypothetical protein IJP39_11125 [Bacteroidales bacterium]|nr:hypothetical protein [Bacteroidales bacterium]MBQ6822953.1 hypothetical protein [Bacteroidales bacterium]MBR0084194.1 hypothetical protein [Bacteroidales bacterium]